MIRQLTTTSYLEGTLAATDLGVNSTAFLSPWMLLAFFVVLIFLSLLSFRCFERPAQAFIRSKLIGEKRLERRT